MNNSSKIITGNLSQQLNNAAKYMEGNDFIDENKEAYIAGAYATMSFLGEDPTLEKIQQATTTMLYLNGMITQSKLATFDPLTEIRNRRAFMNDLEVIATSQNMSQEHNRANNSKKAIVFIDLDYFKEINDNLGHLGGDKALQKVAKILDSTARAEEKVYRIGGDEFTLILDFTEDVEDADIEVAIDRFKSAVSTLTIEHNGEERPLLASMGHHIITGNETEDALTDIADKALYQSKLDKDARQEKVWDTINDKMALKQQTLDQ